ncbi:MAG: hypothetical protein HYX53_12965 [Chloroflexi bacterium]|nr:hypothetical protein [Chloroflexota bacterium]
MSDDSTTVVEDAPPEATPPAELSLTVPAAPALPAASGGNGSGGALPPAPPRRDLTPGGDAAVAPPGVPFGRSSYLNFLPGVYSGDEFLGRFLLIFEHILNPIERNVANIPYVFDPLLTPAGVLPWLGGWLGLVVDPRWPESRRRDLVHSAMRLYRWRGTRRGLSELLRLYTGAAAEITEPTLSQISVDKERAYRFHVKVTELPGERLDEAMVRGIIDTEKPAFTAYTLEIIRAG